MSRRRRWAVGLVAVAVTSAALGWLATRSTPPEAPPPSVASPDRYARELHGLDPSVASTVVARVDGQDITLLDLFDEMSVRGRPSALDREVALASLVDSQLLAGEARRRGLDGSARVTLARRAALARLAGMKIASTRPAVEPTLAELRARYEAEPGLWRIPERVSVDFLRVDDRVSANAIRERVASDEKPSRALQQVAVELGYVEEEGTGYRSPVGDAPAALTPPPEPSADALRYGSTLDFARPGPETEPPAGLPVEVALASFAEPTGAIAVLEGGGQIFVIVKVHHAPPVDVPFEQAVEVVRAQLEEETFAGWLREISEAVPVEIDQERLAAVEVRR